MRIIKEGNLPSNEIEKTCGNCKTVFAYAPADVSSDRDGPYVVCPKCGHFISTYGDTHKLLSQKFNQNEQ